MWQQTDEIEDMERALQILTVEYPRLAAMLEELITALGLEVLIYIYILIKGHWFLLVSYQQHNNKYYFQAEDEVTDDKEASATSLSEEVVSAASVSETNGEEPIHLSNQ